MGDDRIEPLGPSFPCSLMPHGGFTLLGTLTLTRTCWTQYCIQLGLKLLVCKLHSIWESLKVGEASEEIRDGADGGTGA